MAGVSIDIRGIDADQEHAEQAARSRLPVGTTQAARRRAIRVSRAAALTRVLAALRGPRLAAALRRAGGLSAMGYREARVAAAPGGRPIGASWLSNAFSRA